MVEDSIELAAFIAIKLLPNQIGMLGVVARVFDPTIPFYQGDDLLYLVLCVLVFQH